MDHSEVTTLPDKPRYKASVKATQHIRSPKHYSRCEYCGEGFSSHRKAKFCSLSCKQKAYLGRKGVRYVGKYLSSVGAFEGKSLTQILEMLRIVEDTRKQMDT